MVTKQNKKDNLSYTKTAYIYLIPAFTLLAIFVLYPIINTIITSFKLDYKFLTGAFTEFNIRYYHEMLKDPVFRRACVNTSFIAFVCVPASMISALVVALALNSIKRFKQLLITLYYLPQVTNVIAAGFVFLLIFNKNFGLLNTVLGWFGIEPVAWISGSGIAGSAELYNQSYRRCLFVLFVYSMWQGLSLKVILFLAGLQNINPQYYQVAQLDGTSKLNVFRKITWPLLSPTTIYIYVTSSITAFKAYSMVVAMFSEKFGPPGDNSKMMITMVGYILEQLGDYLKPGAVSRASVAAVVLMLIVMILTALQLGITKRGVHYK